jgi:hypothetical protein
MAWTRFKQGTREVLGKSEKYTDIPEDIEDLNSVNHDLIQIYSELIGNGSLINIQSLQKNNQLEYMSKSWMRLSELKGFKISNRNVEFIKVSSDIKTL